MAAEIRAEPEARYGKRRRSSRRRTCNSMMDRREALLLADRLKRRTRDPDVLTLCEYVHGTDVHGTIPAFRRPDVPWTHPALMPSASCPVCVRHVGRQRRRGKKDGAMGAEMLVLKHR